MIPRALTLVLAAIAPFPLLYAQGTPAGNAGWYNGDWQPYISGASNWYLSAAQFARAYDAFVVPDGGWTIVSVFSHNTRYPDSNYGDSSLVQAATQASWEIRTGMAAGNPGSVAASGLGPATETLNLVPGFGLNLCRIQVDGLSVQLPAGKYWLSVTPVVGVNQSFAGATLGAHSIGTQPGTYGLGVIYGSNGGVAAYSGTGHGGTSSDLSEGVMISSAPAPIITRSDQWRGDLASLTQQMLAQHTVPFPAPGISVADFNAKAASLYDRIPALSDAEIRTGIQALVASIEDPHTDVGWGSPSPFRFLPLSFYWFDDGIYVTGAPAAYQNLLGGKVISVGGADIDDVTERLTTLVPHENDQWPKYEIPLNKLTNTDFLFGTGITPDTSGAQIVVETASGDTVSANVQPPAQSSPIINVYQGDLPLYRQHPDRHYWATLIDNGASVYFQYNSCSEDPLQASADFLAQLNQLLGQDGVERVIVDMRNNTGGTTSILDPWFQSIKSSRFNSYGRLYLIVGRATFSAAEATSDEFRDQTAAIFVGEPTGGKPQFQIRISAFNLPYFGITASYSRGTWQTSDPGPTLVPDVVTGLTFAQYMAGDDPAMDAILSVAPPESGLSLP